MNKLAITTLVLTFAFTGAIAATTTPSAAQKAQARQQTQAKTPAEFAALQTAAGKKARHKHRHHHHAEMRNSGMVASDTAAYSEMRIGDPRIVYHEIGTAGSQKGNTIVPFYDEPIRSSKPYEIRYDYAEFGRN